MFKKVITYVSVFVAILGTVAISAAVVLGIIVGGVAFAHKVLTVVPEDVGEFLENEITTTNTATMSHEIAVDTYGDLAIFVLGRIGSAAKNGSFERHFYLKELRQIGVIDPVIEILKTRGYDIEIEYGYLTVSWYNK